MTDKPWPLAKTLVAAMCVVLASVLFGSVGFYAVLVYVIYLASKH